MREDMFHMATSSAFKQRKEEPYCLSKEALTSNCELSSSPVNSQRACSVVSVHGILQARILEWVAMPSSKGSPHPEIKPASSASSALQEDCLLWSQVWKPNETYFIQNNSPQFSPKTCLKKVPLICSLDLPMTHHSLSFLNCKSLLLLHRTFCW